VEASVLEGAFEQGDQPVDELITRERAERLWQALARLKSLDREALIAFYIRGLSLVEMVGELDVPLGTIKRRLHTARKRLKAELEAATADADEWTERHSFGITSDDEDEEDAPVLAGVASGSRRGW
jgi:RNA polymerase sigma-70 factor (ECF subfamily)